MDRYAYIIDLGNTLPEYPESEKTPQNLIEGCQSRVWISANREADSKIRFEADSDALIVKGIVALLMRVLKRAAGIRPLGWFLNMCFVLGLNKKIICLYRAFYMPWRNCGSVLPLPQDRLTVWATDVP